MKLATYKDGSRDGQLVVVSRDLSTAHYANGIASRLQQVLDDWNFLSPQLQDLYTTLNQGKARHAFAFEPRQCMAPLPRAFGWVQAEAWPALTQRLAGQAPQPAGAAAVPPLLQGASDDFLGPCDDAWFGAAAWDIDLGGGLAAITGDVAMGANAEQGLDGVRLLMLANLWRLRGLAPGVHALPAAAFGPVAVTPDELGEAWARGRVQLPLQVTAQGRKLGLCEAGAGMAWHFGELVAHLAKTRNLRAGCVVGAGPVSADDVAQGVACLADKRALEAAAQGAARSAWLALGDTVRLEMKGRDGQSVFGAIAQRVVGPGMAEAAEAADAGEAPDVADAAQVTPDSPAGSPAGAPADSPAAGAAPASAD